jgi:mycobactin polyketide synthetase MbtC
MPVVEERSAAASDPVVVVGMALEAPGDIDTAAAYWELLSQGREALTPFPVDRGWSVRELFAGSRRNGFKEIHDRG